MRTQLYNNEETSKRVSKVINEWRRDESKGVNNQANNRSGIQVNISK